MATSVQASIRVCIWRIYRTGAGVTSKNCYMRMLRADLSVICNERSTGEVPVQFEITTLTLSVGRAVPDSREAGPTFEASPRVPSPALQSPDHRSPWQPAGGPVRQIYRTSKLTALPHHAR